MAPGACSTPSRTSSRYQRVPARTQAGDCLFIASHIVEDEEALHSHPFGEDLTLDRNAEDQHATANALGMLICVDACPSSRALHCRRPSSCCRPSPGAERHTEGGLYRHKPRT